MIGVQNVKAYQTPEANGIYYLYNTGCTSGETGFMSTGNDYGFQVVVDKFGFPVKLISTEVDNTYQFQFIHHNGFLSDNGFMYSDGGNTGDDPRARTITVQAQGDGKYKLINTNNSKEIELWYDHNVVGDGSGNRKDYLWQFFSKDERDDIVAGYTTNVKLAAATSMGMPASVDTEEKFDEYLSTNYIGIDQSSKITNGTFDTNHETTGWTTHNNANRTFNLGWGNAEPKTTPEVYEGAGYINHTTISVDKAGLYKVSVNATYRCGNNDNNNRIGDLGYDGSVAYLQANNNIAKLGDWYSGKINGNGPDNPSEANSVYFAAGKYLTEVYVYVGDTKTIDISLHSHAFTWGGWLMFNNFKLTYYSDAVSDEDATAILATATALESAVIQGSVKTALTDAKNTFNDARTIANYNALSTAIDNANTSKTAYANAKSYLDAIEEVLPSTNFYTADAYDVNYTAPKAGYDNRTLTTEEANSFNFGSRITGNMPALLLSPWKVGDKTAIENTKPYINTWSTEGNTDGSDFHTPFFEYWVGDDSSLDAMTMTGTVTGLTPGKEYAVSLRSRARQTNDKTKIANGVTMKVGSGAAVDISAGEQFNNSRFYIGNFSAIGTADGEGNLVVTIEVAASSNISWLSFRNVNYSDESAVADQFAELQGEATTVLADATYECITGSERTDVETAKAATPSTFSEYVAANTNLRNAIDDFKGVLPRYTALEEAKDVKYEDNLPYASATKFAAIATAQSAVATSASDADAKVEAILSAYRVYVESNALAEGVGGIDRTNLISDANFSEVTIVGQTAGAWAFSQTGGAAAILSGESFTDGDGNANYSYFDYNNGGGNNQNLSQTLTALPKGQYLLTVTARATTAMTGNYYLSVDFDETSAKEAIPAIGNTGGTFGRGWNDVSLVFNHVSDGDVTIHVYGENGKNGWSGATRFRLAQIGVVATIGATGWTTFANPNALDLSKMTASEGDVKAYYASSVGTGKIVMTSTTSEGVAAGTGLMLKGTAGATVTIPVAASGDAISGNMLVGCTTETPVDASASCYVLINNGGTAEFQSLKDNGATIPAGKAYLNTGVISPARLIISFDEEDPTAINAVEAVDIEANGLKDGKYLIDGKIVLVKNGVKYGANGQKLN